MKCLSCSSVLFRLSLEMYLFLFIVFLVIFCYILLDRRFTYWQRKGIPSLHAEYFHGNARGVGKTLYSGTFYKNIYHRVKHLGPIAGFYLFTQPVLMVTDLDLIKTLLIRDFNHLPDRGAYHNERDDPTSANLGSLDGDKWKALRNKISGVFTSGKIKTMFSIIAGVSDKMVQRIEVESAEGSAVDVKSLFARFTMDAIGEVEFGIDCNSLNDPTAPFYRTGLKSISNKSYLKRTMTLAFPELSRKLSITVNCPEVADFYKSVLQQTIRHRAENGVVRNDILSLLLDLKRKSQLTFNEIWSQSIMFVIGGFETTATALTYVVYELAQHREIREKARKSVSDALERRGGEFCYEAINDMHYLEQCLNESMRKYPSGPVTRRIVFDTYRVPNTEIILEKGTQIYIPIYGIHHDPDLYPEPMVYNPDRFAPEETEKRHNFAFLPFGDGPRICLGNRFAIIELKIALAKLLMSYDFELDLARTPVPLAYEVKRIILTPASGVYVNFKQLS